MDRSWASLSSLPPSLAMAPLVPWAQHHDSDLLTQAQWILPSSFLSISMSSLLPGLSVRHHPLSFCLLPPSSVSFPVLSLWTTMPQLYWPPTNPTPPQDLCIS